jgi:large subunit ribosomal protein L29
MASSNVTKAKDLRTQTNEELSVFLRDKSEELFKLRFQHFTGQLENVARLKQVRREIARVKTIIAQKEGA